MNLQQMSLVPLVPGKLFDQYFHDIAVVMSTLRAVVQKEDMFPFSKEMIISFVDQFNDSLELLKVRYGASVRDNFDIDMQYSGFPNNFAFDVLATDKKTGEKSGLSVVDQKALFLDQLFTQSDQEINIQGIQEIALEQYKSALLQKNPFLPFQVDAIVKRDSGENMSYFIRWSVYDHSRNMPRLYAMDLEYSGKGKVLSKKIFNELITLLKSESLFMPRIGDLAMQIDSLFIDIHPKMISRLSLGPIYKPGYQNAKNEIQEIFNSPENLENEFILSITHETILSRGQRTQDVMNGLKQDERLFEIYDIKDSEERCANRRATSVSQYLVMSHYVAQHADVRNCEALGYKCLTREELEEEG